MSSVRLFLVRTSSACAYFKEINFTVRPCIFILLRLRSGLHNYFLLWQDKIFFGFDRSKDHSKTKYFFGFCFGFVKAKK